MNEQHEHTDEIAGTTEQVMPAESPDQPVAAKSSRVKRSLVTAVVAGVVGLGLGAGAMALAGSHGDGGHDRGDRGGHLSDGNMHFDGQMGRMEGRTGGR